MIRRPSDRHFKLPCGSTAAAVVRNASDGKWIATLERYRNDDGEYVGHAWPVLEAAFAPDGRVAIAGADSLALIWDVKTAKVVEALDNSGDSENAVAHGEQVVGVAFSPDGRYLVTTGADNLANVWNGKTGAFERAFRKHGGIVSRCKTQPRCS